MSRLISRLLLSMLVVPFGTFVFALLATFVVEGMGWRYQSFGAAFAGGGTWLFMVAYWWLLWRRAIQWTRYRVYRTLESATFCAATGAGLGYAMAPMWGAVMAAGVGAGIGAFAWMGWTTVIWRQTREEAAAAAPVACPVCGYNLTGLRNTTCPECGTAPTIEELLNRQRSEEIRALKAEK